MTDISPNKTEETTWDKFLSWFGLATRTRYEDMCDEVGDLESGNLELRHRNSELAKKCNDLSAKLDSTLSSLDTSERTQTQLRTDNDKLRADIVQFRKDADYSHQCYDARIDHTNGQLRQLGQIIADLRSAWNFRVDNPKMGPKDRAENNKKLGSLIVQLNLDAPKKVVGFNELPDSEKPLHAGQDSPA
jgi:hypothetical protein